MQRKRGVEGLLPPERKPKRAQLLGLGLGLGLPGCLSDMVEAGSRVQKALLQPVPMFTVRVTPEEYISRENRSLSFAFLKGRERLGKNKFCLF